MSASDIQVTQSRGRKGVEFRLGITNKAKLLAFIPALLAGYMAWLGITAFRVFHPADSSRYTFGLPPLLIALVLMVSLLYLPYKMSRGKIYLLDSGIEFDPGDHDLNVHFPWNGLVFSAPRNSQQMLRRLQLMYRNRYLVFYDLFVPDFNGLVEAIYARKPLQGTSDGMELKLESGRIGHIDPKLRG